jgi:hypothetical protein
LGQAAQQQRRVHVAVVVGGEDHRLVAVEVFETVDALHRGVGHEADHGFDDERVQGAAGRPGRRLAGPVGLEVDAAGRLALGWFDAGRHRRGQHREGQASHELLHAAAPITTRPP